MADPRFRSYRDQQGQLRRMDVPPQWIRWRRLRYPMWRDFVLVWKRRSSIPTRR